MNIGFDVISDLNLDAEDHFNWEGKATSLYLIIAGNISNELRIIHQTLLHLSKYYQGIFYMSGGSEYDSMHFVKHRTQEIARLCKSVNNVAYLHRHVVIINGVALVGCNGWYGNKIELSDDLETLHLVAQNIEEVTYLANSIEKLQLHLDVKKVVVITHSVPGQGLFFGEEPSNISEFMPPQQALLSDTEHKVTCWVYGSYDKNVDTTIDKITYINNSAFNTDPYWPKRLNVEI
jgi:hypothetical protein